MRPGPGPGAAARTALAAWTGAADAGQDALRRAYVAHLDAEPDTWSRSGPPDHLTASCLVLDQTRTRTLLVLHRRGGFWVQPGGHLEQSDAGPREAALREVFEETGLPAAALTVSAQPVDLDHHELGSSFARCRSHLDVAYLAVADPAAATTTSSESDDVAWWPLDELPDGHDGRPAVVDDLPPRLRRAALLPAPPRTPRR